MTHSPTVRHTGTCAVVATGIVFGATSVVSVRSANAAEGAPAEVRLEEVIVTGSLITDPNRESSSPIVITTMDDLEKSGTVTIEAALNQMPQFAPSGSAGNGGQGTGGHATVNLHGLGANRNLVLLDGRRLPLADIFGTVDINLVPESILSSIQTITGGASAVYGSDAMSGVVNFISLDHFEGAMFDAQYGDTEQGDRTQTKGVARLRHDIRRRARACAAFAGVHRSRRVVRQGAVAVLRVADAFLVHRAGHVRAIRDESAESGDGELAVRGLRGDGDCLEHA